MKHKLINGVERMSAKYSLLVVAVVVAILIVNSLWIKLASQQNTDIESSTSPAQSMIRS